MIKLALAAAALLSTASPALAQGITGLYNTGVDSMGAKLSTDNAVDTHYTVGGASTFTTNNALYFQDPNAAFIASQPNGQGGSQTYTLNFDLSGASTANATLSGDVAYDNGVTVFLNGHQLYSDVPAAPGTFDAFENLHAFSATGSDFFQTGTNTLTFQVVDYGQPTGLLVTNLTGSVPEPATWALMVLGFGMVGFGLRYRRQNSTVRFA